MDGSSSADLLIVMKSIKDKLSVWLEWIIRCLHDMLIWLLCRSATKANTLALIRVDAIGDFILWLDSARLIRSAYPDKVIILVCNECVLELADKTGYFDRLIPVNPQRFCSSLPYRTKTMVAVSRLGCEVAIQPTYSRCFATGDALVLISGAQERIGSLGNHANINRWEKWIGDRWYTKLLPADSRLQMEIDRNVEFLIGMGIPVVGPKIVRLPILTDDLTHFDLPKNYIVLAPGASHAWKTWTPASFAAVAESLCEEHGFKVVICCSQSESHLSHIIAVRLGQLAIDLTGMTSLCELTEIIRGANLVIGNDSSAIHLAAAVGTASVCILGGGHFGRFHPYSSQLCDHPPIAVYASMDCFGCGWACSLTQVSDEPYPCIAAVSTQAVLNQARSALGLTMENG